MFYENLANFTKYHWFAAMEQIGQIDCRGACKNSPHSLCQERLYDGLQGVSAETFFGRVGLALWRVIKELSRLAWGLDFDQLSLKLTLFSKTWSTSLQLWSPSQVNTMQIWVRGWRAGLVHSAFFSEFPKSGTTL